MDIRVEVSTKRTRRVARLGMAADGTLAVEPAQRLRDAAGRMIAQRPLWNPSKHTQRAASALVPSEWRRDRREAKRAD